MMCCLWMFLYIYISEPVYRFWRNLEWIWWHSRPTQQLNFNFLQSVKADRSSRGVLPTVVRRCVWSRNFMNEEAPAHCGLSRQKQTNEQWVKTRCTMLQGRRVSNVACFRLLNRYMLINLRKMRFITFRQRETFL